MNKAEEWGGAKVLLLIALQRATPRNPRSNATKKTLAKVSVVTSPLESYLAGGKRIGTAKRIPSPARLPYLSNDTA